MSFPQNHLMLPLLLGPWSCCLLIRRLCRNLAAVCPVVLARFRVPCSCVRPALPAI